MKATWNRFNIPLRDAERRDGTVSVYLDYNLMTWTFGLRAENDECWFEVELQLGPFALSAVYWTRNPYPAE